MASLDHWRDVNGSVRFFAPLLVAVFLSFVSMVPLKLNYFGAIVPSIGLMAVFYWAVYRPEAFGVGCAACLGFLYDVFSGAPLGFNMLLCLVAYGTVVSQRHLFLSHSFIVLWWGYALLACLAAGGSWLFFCLISWRILPFDAVFFQAVAGIALFPVVATVFNWTQRTFLGRN